MAYLSKFGFYITMRWRTEAFIKRTERNTNTEKLVNIANG